MEKSLTREERYLKIITNARNFRETRDFGILCGDLKKIIDLSEDNIDLCCNIYDIAYRRGYNKAMKELKKGKE